MRDISVILATLNRAPFLEACLISLCEQTIEPDCYEICIVDNGCTDATPEVVARIVARYPTHNIFMVKEPVTGLSRARNCGLKATHAPLVALVDDDGTVYPDWLERYINRFAEHHDGVVVVGGEINPVWSTGKPPWLTVRMLCPITASTRIGTESRFLGANEYFIECNSCFRRHALETIGGFPHALGRAGTRLLSGENIIVTDLIRREGGLILFDPDIVMDHHIHADRLRPLWFRHRMFWQGVSEHVVQRYRLSHNLPAPGAVAMHLPLNPAQWAFITGDTAVNIEQDMFEFQNLGFVLAHSGLIPVDDEEPL